jgi:hypothetical protein
MVSLPTRGTSRRFTASWATNRTAQRARPSGGALHTMAMIRCFWLSSRTPAAPGRCLSYSADSRPPAWYRWPTLRMACGVSGTTLEMRGARRLWPTATAPRRARRPEPAAPRRSTGCSVPFGASARLEYSGVNVPYPQYALKHFELELFFRMFSGGHSTSHPSVRQYDERSDDCRHSTHDYTVHLSDRHDDARPVDRHGAGLYLQHPGGCVHRGRNPSP